METVGTLLAAWAFVLMGSALFDLARGRLRRDRLTSRRAAQTALAPGFVLFLLAGLLPEEESGGSASSDSAATTTPAPGKASSGGERIASYDVDIDIEDSGAMQVREVIEYDFGSQQRHGIFRDIPVRHRHDKEHDRVYGLDVQDVNVVPGPGSQYSVEEEAGTARIRIGDPDRKITGRHSYTITYRVLGGLDGFSDRDQLSWNAIGGDWPVPIDRVRVEVTVPSETITDLACFAGPRGSTAPCAEKSREGRSAVFSGAQVRPFEPLTVVVSFPRGAVPTPRPLLEERVEFATAFSLTPVTVSGTLVMLVLVLVGLASLLRQGRDERDVGGEAASAVPSIEATPPDTLRPGHAGVIQHERVRHVDVTATIVDLAVRGYLRIEEVGHEGRFQEDDWRLVKLKEPEGLRQYERLLFSALFGDGRAVTTLSQLGARSGELGEVRAAIYDDVVSQGWFPARPDRVRMRWIVIGVAVLVVGAGLLAVLARHRLSLLSVPLVLGGSLIVVAGNWMPRRTAAGVQVLRRTSALERFIEQNGAHREHIEDQEGLFSEYLPYAVAFELEEEWTAASARLYPTPWYAGSPGSGPARSHPVGGFTSAASEALAPSTSSGGGGSAGGGGGGGGGGSW